MVKTETVWRSFIPQVMRKITSDLKSIHSGVFETSRESIVEGSPLSGSPGMPQDIREGRPSKPGSKRVVRQFKVIRETDNRTALGTDEPSIHAIETGISSFNGAPVMLKSPVGGFHPIALTRQAEDKIVRKVVREVVGG